ncbi:MAG: 50S ribosomal protein L15, partial [Chloroflexi bacterium]|nr:50S ribosomal protein L15 [Chloroflexota bacterium]
MEQHELRPPRGAKKNRKRIGRGNASGHGTYSGKGLKGQQSRSGYKTRPGFEGGQTPMIRRLPRRRGFTNPFRVEYVPVNLRDLSAFAADSEVTPESLRDAGVVRSIRHPIKILGDGELSAALTVKTHRVSAAARAKIEAAGGSVEELTPHKEPHTKRKRGKKKAPALDAGGADQETPAL